MSKAYYEYETKCRRCGRFEEWHFSTSDQTTKLQFFTAVSDYIVNPRQYFCKGCMKDTIQDVVSYEVVPANDDLLQTDTPQEPYQK